MHSRVAAARVARLGTLRRSGAPHLVPFSFVLAEEALYSAVDQKPKRTDRLARLANLAADPRVCVLIDHYEEDWSRLWWVRLDGRAQELPRGAEVERALELLKAKYSQYVADPPTGPVIRIDIDHWRGWAAS